MNAVEELLRGHIRNCRQRIAEAVASVNALEKKVEELRNWNEPPAPSRRQYVDGWSVEEEALLREYYPSLGAKGCAEMLPHRTMGAIKTHASRNLKLTTIPSHRQRTDNRRKAKP